MTFPILGGNGAVAGYSIDNSLRFNDGDSSNLTRTPSTTTNRKTWTFSGWIKRGDIGLGNTSFFGTGSSGYEAGCHLLSDSLEVYNYDAGGGGYTIQLKTNRLFRDVSAWYHVLFVVDTTQATSTDRAKLYINGVQETSFSSSVYPSQNHDTFFNFSSSTNIIGNIASSSSYWDGYLAEYNFIDGQALSPTDFGEFDEDSGIWKPIEYTGTYGTNGFYLDFENSGSLGADQSGNSNNFTPTNLASTDQTTDTPTNNFATFNSLFKRTSVNPTFSEGNYKIVQTDSNGIAYSTQGVYSGKWYAEIKVDTVGTATSCGILEPSAYDNGNPDTQAIYYQSNGNKKKDNVASSYGDSYTTGDIIGIAFDADNGTLAFYKNGVSQGTAFTGLDTNTTWLIGCHGYGGSSSQSANYGNPAFSITSGNSDDNGYGNFEYAPPSGYLALCTQNLATALSPTIDDGSEYFNTVLYTGNGGTQSITGVGFQTDFSWFKSRSLARTHLLINSNVGFTKVLQSNITNAEETTSKGITSVNSDGFTIEHDGTIPLNSFNENSASIVSWNWKCNAGTNVSNTDGSITSTVQANTTAGFSIVTYTGTGSNATVGHGLGKALKFLIVKDRDASEGWIINSQILTGTTNGTLHFNTDAEYSGASTQFQGTNPTSTVFSIGTAGNVNISGDKYVAYCFAEIEGYSKFGSYVGNNSSTDGTFVYLGFRPSFVLAKNISRLETWWIRDSARDTYNATTKTLKPQDSVSEQTAGEIDLLSNGFKLRNNDWSYNYTDTYIYMAFAENPFVSSTGIPVTAR